jgi:hypothetical protein
MQPSLERLFEPLHRKLDVSRLKLAPVFDFGLISILRIALEILLGVLPRVGLFLGEFLSDERGLPSAHLEWRELKCTARAASR